VPVKSRRPEDAELSKKRQELAELESRLPELELQLLNLRLELKQFETSYCAKVAPAFAELDEVEALIAERLARTRPTDAAAAEAAKNARVRAQESRSAATEALAEVPRPAPSHSLKDLYRAAAKKLHPDLSLDDDDRKTRERLMTEVNLAYAEGDEARLEAILEEYDSSPEAVVGKDVGAELVRTIRRISLAAGRIRRIEAEIIDLKASEVYRLKTRVEEGTRQGIDVLSDMVKRVGDDIRAKREHLRTL